MSRASRASEARRADATGEASPVSALSEELAEGLAGVSDQFSRLLSPTGYVSPPGADQASCRQGDVRTLREQVKDLVLGP